MSTILPCECEHIAHFGKTPTPYNNSGHTYGKEFPAESMKRIKHEFGTEIVCSECAEDCRHDCKQLGSVNV